jgi:hypothetical protein
MKTTTTRKVDLAKVAQRINESPIPMTLTEYIPTEEDLAPGRSKRTRTNESSRLSRPVSSRSKVEAMSYLFAEGLIVLFAIVLWSGAVKGPPKPPAYKEVMRASKGGGTISAWELQDLITRALEEDEPPMTELEEWQMRFNQAQEGESESKQ